MKRNSGLIPGLLLVTVLGLLSACTPSSNPAPMVELKMAPLSDLPESIREAPVEVRVPYQFAIANKELLEQIPCYCGCASDGHESNYDCYVKGEHPDGTLIHESHAAL